MDGLAPDDAPVSGADARQLIDDVFAIIDRKLFDPSFHAAERKAAHDQLVAASDGLTRSALASRIDEALKGTGMSHLRFLQPAQVRKLEALLAAPAKTAESETVTVERVGDLGIVRITTFMVPAIRRDAVDRAFERIADAKAVVVDVRGNGGGSRSSTMFVLEHLLGPDRLVAVVRERGGLDEHPFVRYGGLPDDTNAGSAADIAFEHEHKAVAWRTTVKAPAVKRRIFAIIDGGCASSCDAFAGALRDNHAAVLLGSRTAGDLLASVAVRPPWKGHLLMVPIGTVLPPSGESIEGKGVAPDVELTPCAKGDADACRTAALEEIRRAVAR